MSTLRSYPAKMKAVFLNKADGKLVVKETSVPKPGPNEVLIKIVSAPVNPSDIARLKNVYGDLDLATFNPGLEGSGTVVAAGKGLLPHLWLGRRVACSSSRGTSGTWAEYMITGAAMCFPLNRKVSDEQGSMSLVNPLTALSFFEIIKQNRHKAIINNAAASALGRMIELLGVKHRIPVINTVRSRKQFEKLKALGSQYVLDNSDPGFIEKLGVLSHELKATVLFDSVCSRQLGKMIEVLPHGSSVIIYGNLSGEIEIMINPRSLIDTEIKISGFYLANQLKENGMFRNLLNLIKVGRLMSTDLKINIRERYPLTRAQEALESYLGDMSAGKVLLIPSSV
jgi:NADPH:quinone reductase